ncbi:hypothetical protein EHF33_15180 [Deinococcus psychrotolerans]|uniref:Uncharacterized protein n=1 Tax=Deinococcus psychrotolerans TaxID=2489213 RepID=A0A3G8YIY4_9DEIO|nr:hypothetical protein [Deinococcus psychrotolerans]AZI44237.1 hypothetical protein EHF33_15180 [Deinococcus psychrotolerans]
MPHIVSARSDSHADAMQAVWILYRAGLPLRDIAMVSLSLQPQPTLSRHPLSPSPRADAAPFDAQTWWEGFLEAVLSRCLTPETLQAYTAVIRSGTSLILVHGTAELARTARQVLEQSGARNIEVRVSADVDGCVTPASFPVPVSPPAGGLEMFSS